MSVNTGPQETPAVTVGNFAKTLSLFVWEVINLFIPPYYPWKPQQMLGECNDFLCMCVHVCLSGKCVLLINSPFSFLPQPL